MRYSLTVLEAERKAQRIRYDIPVFVGSSIRRYKQKLNFVNGSQNIVDVEVSRDIVFMNPIATIYFYDQIIDPLNLWIDVDNRRRITIDSQTTEIGKADECIYALLDNNNAILHTSGIERCVYHAQSKVLMDIWLYEDIPNIPNASKIVVMKNKKVQVEPYYDYVDHTFKLDYKVGQIHLDIDERVSYIEYDIVNDEKSYIGKPNEMPYPEGNQIINLGINNSDISMVIPAYNDTDVSRVIDAIDEKPYGAYIGILSSNMLLQHALTSYVKNKDKRIVFLPCELSDKKVIVRDANYVQS